MRSAHAWRGSGCYRGAMRIRLLALLLLPVPALATMPIGLTGELGAVAQPDPEPGEPVTATDHGATLMYANTGINASLVDALEDRDLVTLGGDHMVLEFGRGFGLRSYASMDWSLGRHDRTRPYLALSPFSHDVRLNTATLVPERGVYRPGGGLGLRSGLDQGVRWTLGGRGGYALGTLTGPMVGGTLALEVSDGLTTMDSFFLSVDGYGVLGEQGGYSGIGTVGLTVSSDAVEEGWNSTTALLATATLTRVGDRAPSWTVGLGLAIAVGPSDYGAPVDTDEEDEAQGSPEAEDDEG